MCIRDSLQTALAMAKEDPRVFVPQQFTNPANPEVHRSATAREILEDTPGPIDGFCSGVGTGGTLTGIGAVSYTHLDVYKRQAQYRRRRAADPGKW